MENRFGKIAEYIVNNEPEYADKLVSSIELTASCLKELKERIAEGIQDSIKRSDYNAVSERVVYCQDLDALVAHVEKYTEMLRGYTKNSSETKKKEDKDNIDENLNNSNKRAAETMPKKGMSLFRSHNQKKDKVIDVKPAQETNSKDAGIPELYKISFFSQDKCRLFVSNAKSCYLDVSNEKNRVRLIPITVDTKNHIIYMNMESYYEHASRFLKGTMLMQNYSGTECLEIKMDPSGLPDFPE